MKYLIEGEVVDTYGGNFTYRDMWYEMENDEYLFYERYYGIDESPETYQITDEEEIKELISLINT